MLNALTASTSLFRNDDNNDNSNVQLAAISLVEATVGLWRALKTPANATPHNLTRLKGLDPCCL